MNRIKTLLSNINVKQKKIYSPQEISVLKLLLIVKRDNLLNFLNLTSFQEIKQQIKVQNNGKFKVCKMKKYIFEYLKYLERFRKSLVIVQLYNNYVKKM
mgnify:CR=1 FL=1